MYNIAENKKENKKINLINTRLNELRKTETKFKNLKL